MAEMSEKNTKKQILTAYQRALDEVKRLKADQLDPGVEKAKSRRAALNVASAPDQVKGALEMLGESVKDIHEVMKVIDEKFKKVVELDEVIELRSKELKDLYEISVEAESFAAMVDGRKKLEAELDEEIIARRKQWEEEKQHQQKVHNREVAEAEQEHSRKIEEWQYSFDRHVKMKKDELEDQLAAQCKEFQEWSDSISKSLATTQEDLSKRESKMEELEQTIEKLKAETDTRVMEASQAAKDKAKISYNIELNAIKKGHEAEVAVLEGKNASLRDQVENLKAAEASLSAKLNDAYAKIQDVALKSLESQGNSRMVELSRSMAADQPRPGKN